MATSGFNLTRDHDETTGDESYVCTAVASPAPLFPLLEAVRSSPGLSSLTHFHSCWPGVGVMMVAVEVVVVVAVVVMVAPSPCSTYSRPLALIALAVGRLLSLAERSRPAERRSHNQDRGHPDTVACTGAAVDREGTLGGPRCHIPLPPSKSWQDTDKSTKITISGFP
ncbi:unnamed protein product [Boreogadus saida]